MSQTKSKVQAYMLKEKKNKRNKRRKKRESMLCYVVFMSMSACLQGH